jgi:hypothetical protein
MAWGEAIAAVFGTAKTVLDRLWGDQTSAEASLESRAEKAAKAKQQAKEDLRKANIDGDLSACADALDRLNRWDAELRRLRDEAAAKRAG